MSEATTQPDQNILDDQPTHEEAVEGLALLAEEVCPSGQLLGVKRTHCRSEIRIKPDAINKTLLKLRERGYTMLMSLHGVDYYPEEPRLGVCYELLSMAEGERISVKVRVPLGKPHVPSVVEHWPTADYHEREVFDMFGVIFDGHPDLRRILMPEDYVGHPQRRDFPVGGEPVIFTGSERDNPGWWR